MKFEVYYTFNIKYYVCERVLTTVMNDVYILSSCFRFWSDFRLIIRATNEAVKRKCATQTKLT